MGGCYTLSSLNHIIHTLYDASLGEHTSEGVKRIYRSILSYYRSGIENTSTSYIRVVGKYRAYFTKSGNVVLFSMNDYRLSWYGHQVR